MDYREFISDFMGEGRRKGVLNDIVKVALLMYTFLLFWIPISVGKFPLPTPEQIVFIILTYAVFIGKGAGFLRDLAPLVILFFAYEAMRGVVVANEERVITQYWSASQTMNGIDVNITPSMLNIGDSFTINVRSHNEAVNYADVFIKKIGETGNSSLMATLKLDDGGGSYFVDSNRSAELFGEEGVYNITASSPDKKINGSSVLGVTRNVHYKEPLMLESSLFGFLPSAYLQEQLFHEGQVSAIDIIAVLAYCLHFIVPFVFASIVWFKDRELFKRYSASFMILAYAGLITFLVYPAAPPWLASLVGYTSGIRKVYDETSVGLNLVILPSIYYIINANEVAAMPSLHFAFPLLVAIFSARLWGRKGWLVFIYPITVAFSLVYLGEHYFVDIAAGFIYALAALLIAEVIFRKFEGNGKYKRKKK